MPLNNCIKVSIFKPKAKKDIPTREILWYDFFYGKLRKLNAHIVNYSYVKEKYIETKTGKLPLEEAIENVIEYNNGFVNKKFAQKLIEDNCEIFEEYIFKAQPVIHTSKNKNVNVREWLDNYTKYNDDFIKEGKTKHFMNTLSEDEDEILLEVPEKMADDFCYQLNRSDIKFSIHEETYGKFKENNA